MGEDESSRLSFHYMVYFSILLYFSAFLKSGQTVSISMPPICSLYHKCKGKSKAFKITANYKRYSSYVIT